MARVAVVVIRVRYFLPTWSFICCAPLSLWECLKLVDTKRLGYDANEECVLMPPTRPAYAPEFKTEAVR